MPRLRAPRTPPGARSLTQAVRSKTLRQEYSLKLPLPLNRVSLAGDIRPATSTIDLSGFLAGLPLVTVPTIKKTNPEDLIEKMFPCWATSDGARHVAACFWSWLCVLDGKLHRDTCQIINLRRLAVTPNPPESRFKQLIG